MFNIFPGISSLLSFNTMILSSRIPYRFIKSICSYVDGYPINTIPLGLDYSTTRFSSSNSGIISFVYISSGGGVIGRYWSSRSSSFFSSSFFFFYCNSFFAYSFFLVASSSSSFFSSSSYSFYGSPHPYGFFWS